MTSFKKVMKTLILLRFSRSRVAAECRLQRGTCLFKLFGPFPVELLLLLIPELPLLQLDCIVVSRLELRALFHTGQQKNVQRGCLRFCFYGKRPSHRTSTRRSTVDAGCVCGVNK